MFVLIVEYALQKAEVVGPFDHEEDAHAYSDANYQMHIRRVVKLIPPAKK